MFYMFRIQTKVLIGLSFGLVQTSLHGKGIKQGTKMITIFLQLHLSIKNDRMWISRETEG